MEAASYPETKLHLVTDCMMDAAIGVSPKVRKSFFLSFLFTFKVRYPITGHEGPQCEEKSPPLRHVESNPGRPGRSQANKQIRGATAPKYQDRLKWLLPDGSTGDFVVSKTLISQS